MFIAKKVFVTFLASFAAFSLVACEQETPSESKPSSSLTPASTSSEIPSTDTSIIPSSESEESESSTTSSSQSDATTYHVQFVNDDDALLYETDVEEGQDAEYVGETPTKAEDDEFTYTFSGWDPEPTNVHQDLVCKAQFKSEGKEPWSSIEWF